jgi:hypothetical protein
VQLNVEVRPIDIARVGHHRRAKCGLHRRHYRPS